MPSKVPSFGAFAAAVCERNGRLRKGSQGFPRPLPTLMTSRFPDVPTNPRVTKRLSPLAVLGIVLAVPAAIGASLYLLHALSQALHWALGLPAWLCGLVYLVLVLELRVAGEPTPKGVLPAPARRLVLWAGLVLLLVWSWQFGHPAFWVALGMMTLTRSWAWWRRRQRNRDEAPAA